MLVRCHFYRAYLSRFQLVASACALGLGYHPDNNLMTSGTALILLVKRASGEVLRNIWRTPLAVVAILAVALSATAVGAKIHRDPLAPIFVSGPHAHSLITPYYFGYYPGHYSYNSPGPIFRRIDYHGPHSSCRLWRYNYLYWIC